MHHAATALVAFGSALPLTVAAPPVAKAAAPTKGIELVGTASVPGDALDRSGLEGECAPGIAQARLGSMGSGIDLLERIPGGVRIISTCDRGPLDGAADFACRLQAWTLRVDPAKQPAVSIELDATTLLKRADGSRWTGIASELGTWKGGDGRVLPRRLDPEGIRRLPGGNFLVSEEYMPAVLEFTPQGGCVRAWPVPERYLCRHPGKDEESELPPHNAAGRQPNKGFEGLAVTPSGEAWVLLQDPLIQDGALSAKNKRTGRNVRLLRLGRRPGEERMREVVYRLEDPKHGISEMMALDDRRFLVLERDGSDAKFRRIYEIDVTGAGDVQGIGALPSDELPAGTKPVAKRLFLDLADPALGLGRTPEKIEGLCWGPVLADGRRTLVVATDNDMQAEQASLFWVFALPKENAPG